MMDEHHLLSLSPLDGRYRSKIAGLSEFFSEFALMKYRVEVEIKWLLHFTEAGLKDVPAIGNAGKKELHQWIDTFSIDDAKRIKAIEAMTQHDVKAVEYFIKEKMEQNTELKSFSEFVHFGCTSEDINNTAYALMLKHAEKEMVSPLLHQLIEHLQTRAREEANTAMLARTHGQPATPTTLGKEFANITARLMRQQQQLSAHYLTAKWNGATGNYSAVRIAYPEYDWCTISNQFITSLGLEFNAYTTQIEPHDNIAELAGIFSRLNTILIDVCRDLWGYIAMDYFKLNTQKNEVGSSTMPHKVNPIDFENAEGNLGLANALWRHFAEKLPISRWQRDLSDSTVLRNIGLAFGYQTLAWQAVLTGLKKSVPHYDEIERDLSSHWEVIAEAVQTVMRRYHLEAPYEQLKQLTRGKTVTQHDLQTFIETLSIPADVKNELLKLRPDTYLGFASELALEI